MAAPQSASDTIKAITRPTPNGRRDRPRRESGCTKLRYERIRYSDVGPIHWPPNNPESTNLGTTTRIGGAERKHHKVVPRAGPKWAYCSAEDVTWQGTASASAKGAQARTVSPVLPESSVRDPPSWALRAC